MGSPEHLGRPESEKSLEDTEETQEMLQKKQDSLYNYKRGV